MCLRVSKQKQTTNIAREKEDYDKRNLIFELTNKQ